MVDINRDGQYTLFNHDIPGPSGKLAARSACGGSRRVGKAAAQHRAPEVNHLGRQGVYCFLYLLIGELVIGAVSHENTGGKVNVIVASRGRLRVCETGSWRQYRVIVIGLPVLLDAGANLIRLYLVNPSEWVVKRTPYDDFLAVAGAPPAFTGERHNG